MNVVFADTFYFLALVNPVDPYHEKAANFRSDSGALVTTKWVLAEVGDALSGTRNRSIFLQIMDALHNAPDVRIVEETDEYFKKGFELFANRLDKEWSLTDCISFVVMAEMGLTDALTGDHHFEQAGYHALLR